MASPPTQLRDIAIDQSVLSCPRSLVDRALPSLWAVRPDGPEAEGKLNSMFCVYLLQSEKDNSFYIGQTNDLEKRLARHNNGFVVSTKKKIPWCLLGYEKYQSRNEARWREHELKQSYSKKRKFIESFLSS
ncbi:MAG: GIY-YIG nuclease family protein [Candidatus Wildermuthbacteria bacterium]|nr:GIY-YIG nuclease family protein [Candidatus Wildermuthbacteria bacterium]